MFLLIYLDGNIIVRVSFGLEELLIFPLDPVFSVF
jgi:hypothetical protein